MVSVEDIEVFNRLEGFDDLVVVVGRNLAKFVLALVVGGPDSEGISLIPDGK